MGFDGVLADSRKRNWHGSTRNYGGVLNPRFGSWQQKKLGSEKFRPVFFKSSSGLDTDSNGGVCGSGSCLGSGSRKAKMTRKEKEAKEFFTFFVIKKLDLERINCKTRIRRLQ
jgi:hypothetical protein